MDELADSASLVHDPDGLRRRLADDGYLFFRGLLPASEVRAVGQTVLARLRSGGWVDERGVPSLQPRAVNSMDALADPAFRAAMTSADFNRHNVARQLSGEGYLTAPAERTILRHEEGSATRHASDCAEDTSASA